MICNQEDRNIFKKQCLAFEKILRKGNVIWILILEDWF
nr:MAG TPA: hypothetical protein [Caudoviricetes sp.]